MRQPLKIEVRHGRLLGFPGLLTLLFIALKLTGHIAWSWAWVTLPLWLPFSCFAVFALFCLVMALIFN